MLKAILLAWWPYAGWMAAAFCAVWLVLRLAGGRLEIAKLRRVHRCESGGVQTLSFVLTLPLFVMLVLFIIQVSQLMIAIAVVHYAAFAAARSAIVWLPAETSLAEPANIVAPGTFDADLGKFPDWITQTHSGQECRALGLEKLLRIWRAAAIACVPISPSRKVAKQDAAPSPVSEQLNQFYAALVPKTAGNTFMRTRINRKADYAQYNTLIVMRGRDADGVSGPTYNPYPGYWSSRQNPVTGQNEPMWVPWNMNEAGWEDPVTVSVYYNFAMLPGPGRFLSQKLSNGQTPDLVSRHLQEMEKLNRGRYEKGLYVVILEAHATLQIEGLKSVISHVQSAN
jgi:hypothetical protein